MTATRILTMILTSEFKVNGSNKWYLAILFSKIFAFKQVPGLYEVAMSVLASIMPGPSSYCMPLLAVDGDASLNTAPNAISPSTVPEAFPIAGSSSCLLWLHCNLPLNRVITGGMLVPCRFLCHHMLPFYGIPELPGVKYVTPCVRNIDPSYHSVTRSYAVSSHWLPKYQEVL